MPKSLVVRWDPVHILILNLQCSLVAVNPLVAVVLIRINLLPILRTSRSVETIRLVVDLKVGHRLSDLVDTGVHCFEVLALRILIVLFNQWLVILSIVVFEDHLLWNLILVHISLIRDLFHGVFVDVVLVLNIFIVLD